MRHILNISIEAGTLPQSAAQLKAVALHLTEGLDVRGLQIGWTKSTFCITKSSR